MGNWIVKIKESDKRIVEYLLVVISCSLVGAVIAYDHNQIAFRGTLRILYEKNAAIFFFLILTGYWSFLKEYVHRYANESGQDQSVCVTFFILFVVAALMRADIAEKAAVLALIIVLFMGALFYRRLSRISRDIVRFELVWPSLCCVALAMYTGYFLVVSSLSGQEAEMESVVPYIVFALYTILLFGTMGSDQEQAKHPYLQRQHDRKRQNKPTIKITAAAVLYLIWTVLWGTTDSVIVFMCICTCFEMTVFEAWDVISRRTGRRRKEYEAVLGGITGIFLILMSSMLALVGAIDFFYLLVLLVAALISNAVSVFISRKTILNAGTGQIKTRELKLIRSSLECIYCFLWH